MPDQIRGRYFTATPRVLYSNRPLSTCKWFTTCLAEPLPRMRGLSSSSLHERVPSLPAPLPPRLPPPSSPCSDTCICNCVWLCSGCAPCAAPSPPALSHCSNKTPTPMPTSLSCSGSAPPIPSTPRSSGSRLSSTRSGIDPAPPPRIRSGWGLTEKSGRGRARLERGSALSIQEGWRAEAV
jgi:hypothetical protein